MVMIMMMNDLLIMMIMMIMMENFVDRLSGGAFLGFYHLGVSTFVLYR